MKCSVETCEKDARVTGLCYTHYNQWVHGRNPQVIALHKAWKERKKRAQ